MSIAENQFLTQDAPSTKMAEAYITIGTRRYSAFHAKNVKVNANVSTQSVPVLGRTIPGRKATGMEVKIDMTVYKCTEIFDDLLLNFKKSHVLPTFDLLIASEDPATKIGRSSKMYKACVIDGDVLLSMFDSDGNFVEQQITAYAQDFEPVARYTTPSYLKQ